MNILVTLLSMYTYKHCGLTFYLKIYMFGSFVKVPHKQIFFFVLFVCFKAKLMVKKDKKMKIKSWTIFECKRVWFLVYGHKYTHTHTENELHLKHFLYFKKTKKKNDQFLGKKPNILTSCVCVCVNIDPNIQIDSTGFSFSFS